jgi:steroid delta-isomerase-like uncharacterized protein
MLMRTIVGSCLVVGALLVVGCDDKSSGGASATPSASASAAASAAPSASAAPAASGSAAPEKEEKEKTAKGPKDHAARSKALVEAFGGHDAKKLAALYSEDALVKTVGSPDVKGRAAIEKGAEGMFGVFKDAKLSIGRVWVKDKHTVVMESVFSGTNTGDSPEMGIPKATNKATGVAGAMWLEVDDDGLIKEEHRYWDMPTTLGQLNPPDPKNPVRPVLKDVPNGTEIFEAKKDEKEAKKEDKKEEKAAKAEEKAEAKEDTKLIELEKKTVEALNSHKAEEALKLVADDVVLDDYTQPAAIKGKAGFKAMLDSYFKAFPDLKASVENMYAVGDNVVVEFKYTGIQKGPLGAIKPTNKPVEMHQVEVDTFKDGKLTRAWAWGNNAELLSELGILPKAEKAEKGEKTKK